MVSSGVARVRAWEVWSLPRMSLGLIGGLLVVAVAATAGAAVRYGGDGGSRGHLGRQALTVGVLAVMFVVHGNVSRRSKAGLVDDIVDVNSETAWFFSLPLLLPFAPAVLVSVVWEFALSQRFQNRRAGYKALFNRANAVVTNAGVALVVDRLLPVRDGLLSFRAAGPARCALAVVGFLAVDFVMNLHLSATIAAASRQRFRDVVWGAIGIASGLAITGLSLMVAAVWTLDPGLVVLVLPLTGTISMVSQRFRVQDTITRDSKTRLLNAAGWRDRAEAALGRTGRDGGRVGVLMVDLDHFKRVNDTWSHVAGDAVLAGVAAVLRSTIRGRDEAGRFGGEEFVVVLPGADDAGAAVAAERIRAAVAASSVLLGDGTEVRVTASIGVSSGGGGDALDAILGRADRGVYLAKESGRDAVRVGAPELEAASVGTGAA